MSKSRDSAFAHRREFLKLVGVSAAATTLPFSGTVSAEDTATVIPEGHHTDAAAAPSTDRHSYRFFNTAEAAFVEAAVDTLIPSDSVGPGALELGVADYIDRQMAGSYGRGHRLYLQGPFGEGTPQQGYQLSMTPAELLRAGIADVAAHVLERFHKAFDALSPEDRIRVLADLDGERIELPTVPLDTFFTLLLQMTIEGYFADPIYGGNKNKAAWQMIGFPGADAMYSDKIEPFRNKPYVAAPLGIQDLI